MSMYLLNRFGERFFIWPFLAIVFTSFFNVGCKTVSPYEFGISKAKNGIERYNILLKTHEVAISKGYGVSYKNIKTLDIEIPVNAESIPLPDFVDFCGVKLVVRNNSKDISLFCNKQNLTPISINKNELNDSDFRDIKELKKDLKLLIIQDQNPWIRNRRGYSYGVYRKDLLFIKDGIAENTTIQPYDDMESNPLFYYCIVTNREKEYKNLVFERTSDSKYITRLFEIENQYNIVLRNINIKTPESKLHGDKAIMIINTARALLKDVTIDGTYSQKNEFGYGINMNNVWDVCFQNLKADGNWGIFGNNNVNYAILEGCDINRFDVHCYGRDVYCKNTTFRNMYNQFSSFYGDLVFKGCQFKKFVPVMFEDTYAAYTHFNLSFEDCEIDVDDKRTYLIHAGTPTLLANNPRTRFTGVEWPNVKINKLKVFLPANISEWRLFAFSGNDNPMIKGIESVKIENLELVGGKGQPTIKLSNKKIKTVKPVAVKIKSSTVNTILH